MPWCPSKSEKEAMAPRAEMPLFPCEADIARAILGPGRVSEWKAIAIILERPGSR